LTNWRFDNPAAVIIPNMTQKVPPMMGSGIVMKRAPILDKTPKRSIMKAAAWITLRLPTCVYAIPII